MFLRKEGRKKCQAKYVMKTILKSKENRPNQHNWQSKFYSIFCFDDSNDKNLETIINTLLSYMYAGTVMCLLLRKWHPSADQLVRYFTTSSDKKSEHRIPMKSFNTFEKKASKFLSSNINGHCDSNIEKKQFEMVNQYDFLLAMSRGRALKYREQTN